MGVWNVAVCFGYILFYEAQLIFMNLVASTAILHIGKMELCGFYSLTTTEDNA